MRQATWSHLFQILFLTSIISNPIVAQDDKSKDAKAADKSPAKGPWVTSIAVGPTADEAVMATGSGLPLRPSQLLRGNASNPASLQNIVELPAAIWKVVLVDGRSKVVASDYSGGIHLGSLSDPASFKKLDTKTRWSRAMVPTKDGRVLIGTEDGKIVPLSVADGTVGAPIEAHKAAVFGMNLSADGSKLLTASGEGVVKLWNMADMSLIKEIPVAKVAVWDVIFALDGAVIVTADADRRVNLYSADSGKLQMSLGILPDWATSLALLPNQVVAAGCLNGKVYFFDVPSKLLMMEAKGPGSGVWSLAACDDGAHLWVGTRSQGVSVIAAGQWEPALAASRKRAAEEVPPSPK